VLDLPQRKMAWNENTLVVYNAQIRIFISGAMAVFDKRFMYERAFRTPLLMSLARSSFPLAALQNALVIQS